MSAKQPVPTNAPVALIHCGTHQHLASDVVKYRNDFGTEVCTFIPDKTVTVWRRQSLPIETVNSAQKRQSRPGSGLGFQAEVLQTL